MNKTNHPKEGVTMPKMSVSKDEGCVHVELDIGTEEIGTIEGIVQQVEDCVGSLIEEIIEIGLEMKLKDDLGPRWGADNAFEDKRCPKCGDQKATRKEFRERSVTVSSDRNLSVSRPIVTCGECGSEYRPYDGDLGLSDDGHQHTVSTMLKVMTEAIRTTYAKAAKLLEHGPGPKTIWRYVTNLIPDCLDDGAGHSPVVVDGTQVPKWRKSGQRVVSIAHGLSQNSDDWNRQVVGTAFGEEVDIKLVLGDVEPSDLIHDGRLDLDGVAESTRRCRWHVPHSVRQLLYQDGITGKTNRFLVDQLEELVWDDGSDESNYRVQLIHWARRYEAYAPHAAAHVRHAVEGLVKTRRHELQTTSLAEREMKEINKRLENGGGWTDHGGKAMIQHHQMLRHEPEEWTNQMTEILGNAMSHSTQNSVI
jgi:hypothetical protein